MDAAYFPLYACSSCGKFQYGEHSSLSTIQTPICCGRVMLWTGRGLECRDSSTDKANLRSASSGEGR